MIEIDTGKIKYDSGIVLTGWAKETVWALCDALDEARTDRAQAIIHEQGVRINELIVRAEKAEAAIERVKALCIKHGPLSMATIHGPGLYGFQRMVRNALDGELE